MRNRSRQTASTLYRESKELQHRHDKLQAVQIAKVEEIVVQLMTSNPLPQVCPCTSRAVARDHRQAARSSAPGSPPYIRASGRVQARR